MLSYFSLLQEPGGNIKLEVSLRSDLFSQLRLFSYLPGCFVNNVSGVILTRKMSHDTLMNFFFNSSSSSPSSSIIVFNYSTVEVVWLWGFRVIFQRLPLIATCLLPRFLPEKPGMSAAQVVSSQLINSYIIKVILEGVLPSPSLTRSGGVIKRYYLKGTINFNQNNLN